MKSITTLLNEAGFGELICPSFEEAEKNNRKKNLVVIDDTEIYLTYKLNGVFGEFVCWVEEEFEANEDLYDTMLAWVEDIYGVDTTEEEIEELIAEGTFIFDFTPYKINKKFIIEIVDPNVYINGKLCEFAMPMDKKYHDIDLDKKAVLALANAMGYEATYLFEEMADRLNEMLNEVDDF